jgi:fumarate hydratase, class II
MKTYREEKDAMGTVRVPEQAYYGAQTQRAVENFAISNMVLPEAFIAALALVKGCAAQVNRELNLLDGPPADAIVQAADEVHAGSLADQFVVDVFQTGSGTSTNMNMNEVIAARANEILTGRRGGKAPVHPNDHVNLGQSSNDVIPTVIHMSAMGAIRHRLVPALARLETALARKAEAFAGVRKLGRTHLQDAVPMTLGQVFSGYARQVTLGMERLEAVTPRLCELALGGTAVGTGMNTHPAFPSRTIAMVAARTGLPFVEAANHFSAQAAQDAAVETSGLLKTLAVSLVKIANDVRWLASGPRSGIGEITIPSLQPGSSIMPGKVNPVIPEAVIQVAAQVVGNDTVVTLAGQSGNFELNVMLPVVAHNLLQSISLLASSSAVFADRCIAGIVANTENCSGYIEKSLAMATGLVPRIGYDRAAALAKKAFETGKTVRAVALEEGGLDAETLNDLLGPPVDG